MHPFGRRLDPAAGGGEDRGAGSLDECELR